MQTTRRNILRQAGAAAVVATTAPWWLVRRAHAARDKKLVVWNPTALAPQVDKIMEEQCYAYAKQAGIKDSELDYSVIGSGQLLSKLVATLEAGNPPDITRLDAWLSTLYRSQGHLLEVTDLVEKMQRVPGGLFPIFSEVMHQGKAYAIPQSVSPSPLVTRLDILEAAKVEPPKTWDEFIEVCKKLQQPPKLTGYGMCLGIHWRYQWQCDEYHLVLRRQARRSRQQDRGPALPGHRQGRAAHCGYVPQTQDHPQGHNRVGQHREQQSLSVPPGHFCAEFHEYLCASGGIR